MTTTADRLRIMQDQLAADREKLVREYYDMANAQMRGEPIKEINNGAFLVVGKNGRTVKIEEDSAAVKTG